MIFLMLVVLFISIVITAMKFGVVVLQDNFVVEILINYENFIEFVVFYGFLNFYMYIMVFVYLFFKNVQYGKGKVEYKVIRIIFCVIKFVKIG